jgi:F0F1-type ATP synthase beta subunit
MEAGTKNGKVGTVEEIQGVVIEVAFPEDLPEIYNALEVDLDQEGDEEGTGRLVLEV